MAALESGVASPQQELATLRRRRWSLVRFVLLAIVGTIAALVIVTALQGRLRDTEGFVEARDRLLNSSSRAPWTAAFIERQDQYGQWLIDHGTELEADLFNRISQFLFKSAAIVDQNAGNRRGEDPVGFVTGVYVSFNFALMRIAFIVIASWRLWTAAILVAWLYGLRAYRPHAGPDALGETGNDRLFFSGAYAGLKQLTPSGAPAIHVTGLACVPKVPLAEVSGSSLGQVLQRYQCASPTARSLAATILKHPSWPCYVASPEESAVLHEVYAGSALPQGASLALDAALQLHAYYRDVGIEQTPEFLSEPIVAPGAAYSAEQYAALLQSALHRVLNPSMRQEIARLPVSIVATTILAFEAGKALAYRFETNRWIRKSNFPQLCARAVVHSQPTFGREFDFDERALVRRALIFGSRQSVFAPVRFPVDLKPQERALRQWVELLIAGPHSLQSTADEVELFGRICQVHEEFVQRFVRGPADLHTVADDIYASPSNVFFMSVQRLLQVFRQFIAPDTLKRMEELVFLVSQRQRIHQMSRDLAAEGGERTNILQSFERVFPPLSHAQMKTLAELHEISPTDIREWSTLRVVLNAFGWLGRRVGDYSVPESSVIFGVFKVEPGTTGANANNFIGRKGMVALRATRLEDAWGKGWRGRFQPVMHATMAETIEDYEKRMRGEVEPLPSIQDLADIGTVNL